MSYHAAAALQAAVYQRLTGWPALAGVQVVDALPAGNRPATFVLLGPEVVLDRSDKTGSGAEHRFDISVISTQAGFLGAKEVAGTVFLALDAAPLGLGTGVLVALEFQRATARRLGEGAARRIDLTFRARIDF